MTRFLNVTLRIIVVVLLITADVHSWADMAWMIVALIVLELSVRSFARTIRQIRR